MKNLPWIIAVGAVGAVVYLLWRTKKKVEESLPPPRRPTQQDAIDALNMPR